MRLTLRQRASWLAHLYKACAQQHHRALKAFARRLRAVRRRHSRYRRSRRPVRQAVRPHGFEGRVWRLLEPSDYARSIVTKALAFNRLDQVTVVPVGLSDRAHEAVLHTPLKASSAWGFGTAHLGRGSGDEADQTVALMRLDDFATQAGLTRLDLIKADIEGWEMRALVGGEATLRRYRPALLLEVDGNMMERAGDTSGALFSWLSSLGYDAVRVPDLTPAPQWAGTGDYLFRANERP